MPTTDSQNIRKTSQSSLDPAGGVLKDLVPARPDVGCDNTVLICETTMPKLRLPNLWALIFAACVGSFLFGYSVALMNTALNYVSWEFHWCETGFTYCNRSRRNEALVTTAVFIGAGLGALISPTPLRRGRRFSILLALWGFVFGTITTAVAKSVSSIFWGRLVVGIAVGLVSVAVPVYISEMAPPPIRGKCGIMHQLFIVFGVFTAILLGLPLTLKRNLGDGHEQPPLFIRVWWRCMTVFPILPAAVCYYFLGFKFSWETPHSYLKQGNENYAQEILRGIYKRQEVTPELEAIAAEIKSAEIARITGNNFLQIIRQNAGARRALGVGILVSAFQQLSGINVFISASTSIFKNAGFQDPWPILSTAFVFFAFLIFTFPSIYTIDSMGRRPLLLVGTFLQTLALAAPAVGAWVSPESKFAQYSAVVGVCLFLISFAAAYGPVLWVFLFELFPLEIKSSASSISVAVNWMAAIGLVFAAKYMSNRSKFTTFAGE